MQEHAALREMLLCISQPVFPSLPEMLAIDDQLFSIVAEVGQEALHLPSDCLRFLRLTGKRPVGQHVANRLAEHRVCAS